MAREVTDPALLEALDREASPEVAAALDAPAVPQDDPTGSLAGGPEMPPGDLFKAGMGQGAIKAWMGVKDIAGRVPGLDGIRPSPQEWQDFNALGAPLLSAQRSDPTATVRLPVAMTQGMSPEDIAYVQQMADADARKARNPGAEGSTAGTMAVSTLAGMGAGKVLSPILSRVLPAGAQGAALGAVEGAAAGGVAADQDERLTGAALGGAGGGFLGWLLQRSGLFVPRRQVGAKPPRVAVSPEAAALEAEGVPLTAGQRAGRGSAIGDIEQLSAKGPFGMAGEREAARQEWMRVAQNKGVAPGAQVPTNPELQGRLDELFRGFAPAYDKFRNLPADPAAMTNVLQAASMPRQGVPQSVAAGVAQRVEDALSSLGPRGPMQRPTVGDLMDVRDWIRQANRRAIASQNFEEQYLLDMAEQTVTDGINASMGPAEQAALRATDRQYARLMTAADAPPTAQDVFTPQQYLRQVERRAGPRNYARGLAGDLQDLGENARTVFTEAPPTGFTPGMLEQFTGKVPGVGGLVSRAANTGAGRRFLFDPRAVMAGPRSEAPASSSALADLLDGFRARWLAEALARDKETGNGK